MEKEKVEQIAKEAIRLIKDDPKLTIKESFEKANANFKVASK